MTTKHTPATPLPWSAMFGLRKGTVHSVGSTSGEHTAKNRLTPPIERADAAYIAHAANAYPKLVEALADVLRDQLKQVNLHQMAPGPRQRIEKARALLRELGEES